MDLLMFRRHALAGCSWLLQSSPALAQAYDWQATFGDSSTAAVFAGHGMLAYGVGSHVIVVRVDQDHIGRIDRRINVEARITAAPTVWPSVTPAETTDYDPFEPSDPGGEGPWVFVPTDAGWLYRVNLRNGSIQSRDLRRGSCSTDKLAAAPVLIARALPDGDQGIREVLVIGTHHGCGDDTQNQIIALDPLDITKPPAWTFNFGEYEVGAVTSCVPDAPRNSVYCSAHHTGSAYQNTVFSLDATNGELKWATGSVPIDAEAALRRGDGTTGDRLYVGDVQGILHSIEPDGGKIVWSLEVGGRSASPGVPAPIVGSITLPNADPYRAIILVVDGGGILSAIYENGTEGIVAWSSSFAGGQRVTSRGEPATALAKVYVGLNDGTVHQLNLASGADESAMLMGLTSGARVGDPLVFIHRGKRHLVASSLSASAGHVTRQYTIPCAYAAMNCHNAVAYVPPLPIPAAPTSTRPSPAPAPPLPAKVPETVAACERAGAVIRVRANGGWCNSGVKLSRGERVNISAQGRWSNTGPPQLGPDGFVNYSYPGTILSNANLASLIGKTGEFIFPIGKRLDRHNDRDGWLLLSINDTPGTFGDNQGFVDVTIRQLRE